MKTTYKWLNTNIPTALDITLLAVGLVSMFIFIGWEAILIWAGSYAATAIVYATWSPWNEDGGAGLLLICSLFASGLLIHRSIRFYHRHFAFLKE